MFQTSVTSTVTEIDLSLLVRVQAPASRGIGDDVS
jgi:hypothetical protein